MPAIHRLEGGIGVRQEPTHRVLVVDTGNGESYEIWLDPIAASVLARALSPIGLANGKPEEGAEGGRPNIH